MNRVQSVGPASQKQVADLTLICDPTTGVPITSFGTVGDTRFDAIATILQRLEWVDLQNQPISNIVTNAYLCSAYNLLNNGRLEILANANRRGLRILNASGNASGFNRCDILVGTKYQPTVTKFNRVISFDDDKLLDGPTLQQFVSCLPISGQPLDGYFVVVELF